MSFPAAAGMRPLAELPRGFGECCLEDSAEEARVGDAPAGRHRVGRRVGKAGVGQVLADAVQAPSPDVVAECLAALSEQGVQRAEL